MRVVNLYFSRVVSLFCALLCAFMLVGCSDKAALESVDYVLHNAQQEPVEALERIRSIDKNSIRGKHNRARYALAYSEALYYNRINSDCDTLVRPLFGYYHDSDKHSERARALYQCALVKYNSNQFTDALYNISKAHTSLDIVENFRLRGLLYRTEGFIYGQEMLFQNAIESHIKAKESFEKAELSEHYLYSIYDIGCLYSHIQDFDTALEYMNRTISICETNNNRELLEQAICDCCDICLCAHASNNNDTLLWKAKDYMSILDTMPLTTINKGIYYSNKAVINASDKQANRAIHNLFLADNSENPDTNHIMLRKYWINKDLSNYQDALYWLEKCHHIENNHIIKALEIPSINFQLEITRKEYDLERQKNINSKLRFASIILLVLVITISIIAYILKCNYVQRQLIEQYTLTVRELKSVITELKENNRTELTVLFNNQYYELNNLLDAYYEHADSPRQQTIIYKRLQETILSLKSDSKRINEIEKYVNIQHNNLMQRLRNQCPQLSDRDFRIILYSYAGLSLRAISIFLDSKPETLSKAKYRIKNKIKDSGAIDADEFINML